MNKSRIFKELVFKVLVIKFVPKHRQSMGKVELCIKVAGLLRKVAVN